MPNVFIVIFLLEVTYLGGSFALALHYGQWSFEGEEFRLLARLIALFLFVYFYRKYFYQVGQKYHQKQLTAPLFTMLVIAFFGYAIVFNIVDNENAEWQGLFAISGLVAGFREELLYRGMIQQTLQKCYKPLIALLLAAIVFMLSHIQYIYYEQFNGLLLIFCSGIIFGCVFLYTNNVLITALVHGVYDALLSVKLLPSFLPNALQFPLLLAIMLSFLVLSRSVLTNPKPR